MPNNTNLIFMVSDPKTGEMPARKLKNNTSSVVAGKIGSNGCGIQDTLRDDPMHFEGRGLAIPGLFSVAVLCDFAVKHWNQRLSFTQWLDIAKPPRSLTAKPNSRKRFYDKESKQSEATA